MSSGSESITDDYFASVRDANISASKTPQLIENEDTKNIENTLIPNSDQSTAEEDDDIEIDLVTRTDPDSQIKALIQTVPVITKAPKLVVLSSTFSNTQLKPNDLDERTLTTNYPIFEYDIEKGEKPWRKPGSDISDYFNYGFNEETWKIYCEKQRRLRVEGTSVRRIAHEGGNQVAEPPMADHASVPISDTAQNVQTNALSSPPPFQLPPGMNLNLPPELANSIASLAASSLGLSSDFIAQLPSISNFMPQNLNPQMFFPPMFAPPLTDLEATNPESQAAIDENTINRNRGSPSQREVSPPKETAPRHSSRPRVRREEEQHREDRRHRERRSHSRDRSHRERRPR